MFRGKATLEIWFEAEKFVRETEIYNVRQFFGLGFGRYLENLGAKFDYNDDEYSPPGQVCVNGSTIWVNMTFDLKNGESFTHAAMQKFVKLVTLIGDETWRGRFFLPMPQIVQETMVEAYCEDNWVTYGEYLYVYQPKDPIGPKSDIEKELDQERKARISSL